MKITAVVEITLGEPGSVLESDVKCLVSGDVEPDEDVFAFEDVAIRCACGAQVKLDSALREVAEEELAAAYRQRMQELEDAAAEEFEAHYRGADRS